MTPTITYNPEEYLYEVTLTRARLESLVERGVASFPVGEFAAKERLRNVARTAGRVLACTSKKTTPEGRQCGCPAILAIVDSGTPYSDAHLRSGTDYMQFADGFDRAVTSYVEGLLDAGIKHGGSFYSPAGRATRLIVVD